MSTAKGYLNGQYAPLAELSLSPMDRGFLFGDGVYEVIPFYYGKGLGLSLHLQRLSQSLSAVGIDNPMSDAQWRELFKNIIDPTASMSKIYCQVTRGQHLQRQFDFGKQPLTPTVFAYGETLSAPIYEFGQTAWLLPDNRWGCCQIKSINLLPSCLAMEQANRHGANTAILERDGIVTEGAQSNVFIVKKGVVSTTPATENILKGITRQIIFSLSHFCQVSVVEQTITVEDLFSADEVWVTSSTKEIAPVTSINNKTIGSGAIGEYWYKFQQQYQSYIQEHGEIV